jgi:hypothetical protein
MKLKEKIKQIKLSHLNQKIKRQNSTNMRQQIIIKDLRLKINHLEKEKRIKSEEKSTQCNITKKIIDDLKDEIDLLHFEKERQDENNNENIETRNASPTCCFAIKLISLLQFAAVDSLGSSSMCISNTSKMDLIRGAQCCRPIPRLLKL